MLFNVSTKLEGNLVWIFNWKNMVTRRGKEAERRIVFRAIIFIRIGLSLLISREQRSISSFQMLYPW